MDFLIRKGGLFHVTAVIFFFLAGVNLGVPNPIAWGLMFLTIGTILNNIKLPTPHTSDNFERGSKP